MTAKSKEAREPKVIVSLDGVPYEFGDEQAAADWVAAKLMEGVDIGEFDAFVDGAAVPIMWEQHIIVRIGTGTGETVAH